MLGLSSVNQLVKEIQVGIETQIDTVNPQVNFPAFAPFQA